MVDGYTAVYNAEQAGWAVGDIIGGLFDGFAGMSKVLGIGIIALVILGIIAGFITKIQTLA